MFLRWWTENSSIHRRHAKTLMLLFLAFLFGAMTAGCSLLPKEEEEETLPKITPPQLSKKPEYEVKTTTLVTEVRGSGKLMSLQEETLFFTEDNKRIKDVYVKTGDQVKQGQLIAELDVSDLENELRQKKLQLKKTELSMIETLRKADSLDAAELEQAKIDFEMERTKLTELEESIGKAKLTAPFAGTIVSVSVKKGDSAKAYDPVAVVADLSKLTVAAEFSKDDLAKVAVGMEAIVEINAAGEHKGKVKQLPVDKGDEEQDPYNPDQNQQDSIDNYLLVELDKMPPNLTRGTPVGVTVITQRKENAVVIPASALRTYGGRTYVQVVDDKGKREVDVEVGQQTSTEVEIVKGLEPGQKVVGR